MLIEWIGEQTSSAISGVPEGNFVNFSFFKKKLGMGRQCVAVLLILWVSAIVSACVDNIPYTAGEELS